MRGEAKKLLYLIGRDRLPAWVLLIGLGVAVALTELIGGILVFVLLGNLTAPGSAQSIPIVGPVRDRFSGVSDESFLLWTAVTVGVFFLFRAGLLLLQTYLQNRLAQNAGVRLSSRLFRAYLDMPYALHLRRNSAELMRNVHGSVHQIIVLGFSPVAVITSEALVIVGVASALLLVSPAATGLALAILGPLVFLLLRFTRRSMRRWGRVHQDTSRALIRVLQESLHGLREIKLLARESYFQSRFATSRSDLARAVYMQGMLGSLPRVTTETLLILVVVVFLMVAIATDQSLTGLLAIVGMFGYAGLRLMPAANRIVTNVNNLQFGRAAVNDVYEELRDLEGRKQERQPAMDLSFNDRLTVEGVSFAYAPDSPPVLNDISFSIAKGESIGIVGATGAGKSTLLDIMLALLTPTKGRVTVDGKSVHESPPSWHANLGVVPQTTFLIDDSLRRNIAFGLDDEDIDERGVLEAVRLAQLEDFVVTLPDGLATVVGERGVRLSGGQRQRVAIARCLYRNPDVLFFDEATSSLDNITEAKVLEGLEVLYGSYTIVMVAHRLSTLRACDRILVLDGGRLVDSGTFDSLLQRNALFQQMSR